MKAILLIRTSTVKQEIESQKAEISEYAKTFGYSDFKVIGDSGASAIKLDTLYLKNIEEVYSSIEKDPTINCVFAWAIDRIGRNEEVLMHFKNFMINHKVQLVIKNPNLILLNSDGSVNTGVELAFSLFATMAKQEMEMKQARFKRAKTRLKAQGKFAGGSVKYGYSVMPDGTIYLDPSCDGYACISDIFNEYVKGNYSLKTLANEMNSRGYKTMRNRFFTSGNIHQILIDSGNIPIVGAELFNKAQKIMKERWHGAPRNRTTNNLAVGILKCKECGGNYVRFHTKYRCLTHSVNDPNKKQCTCKDCIDVNKMDAMLLKWAKIEEQTLRLMNTKDSFARDQETIKVVSKKIEKLEVDLTKYDVRRLKIQEGYEEGIYNKSQYQSKLEQLKKVNDEATNELISMKKELRLAKQRVANYDQSRSVEELTKAIITESKAVNELTNDYELVHKHIKVAQIERINLRQVKVFIRFASRTAVEDIIK